MPSSTAKRVVLYRFDRQPADGVVDPGAYLGEDQVEVITLKGALEKTAYREVKAVCFVSENGASDLFTAHKLFERRPKVPGLWTRFTFRDGDRLDGILSHNLLDWPGPGYLITPPKAGASRQRVFIPRAALIGTELRGVVGRSRLAAGSGARAGRGSEEQNQLRMFES